MRTYIPSLAQCFLGEIYVYYQSTTWRKWVTICMDEGAGHFRDIISDGRVRSAAILYSCVRLRRLMFQRDMLHKSFLGTLFCSQSAVPSSIYLGGSMLRTDFGSCIM